MMYCVIKLYQIIDHVNKFVFLYHVKQIYINLQFLFIMVDK